MSLPTARRGERPALLLALLSAALFGAATPISKALLAGLSPFQLAGLLYLGAALSLAPRLLLAGRLRPVWRVDARTRRLLAGAVLLGGVGGRSCPSCCISWIGMPIPTGMSASSTSTGTATTTATMTTCIPASRRGSGTRTPTPTLRSFTPTHTTRISTTGTPTSERGRARPF